MNVLRGDIARFQRCTNIITGSEGSIPRAKPFKYTYEKEIVMYAYFKKLDYFSTECIYSPNAYRGFARGYIKDLESIRPSSILGKIYSKEGTRKKTLTFLKTTFFQPLKVAYKTVLEEIFPKINNEECRSIIAIKLDLGFARGYIKDLESIRPSSILGICKCCGYISSQEICKACVMLEGLNKGLPKLGIGKSSKVKKKMEDIQMTKEKNSNPSEYF
ncbi:cytoplasmic tRNA 2-thiolation protein 1-like [Centruroides sculpturatus]|uniref:cytoplasmic tRNA 2-thiolation protein 1-like n=1 Tax=Centruroides sculpturatus TaxID=218467 RepID=UPI000C6CB1D2|nr:cytoplasmic tRNA 2-thiolation protein 1-like [Centruroides sculpturatus]